MATIIDFILPEDQQTYKEIIERAAEAKANAPKKTRKPLTIEQKISREEKKLAKYREKLEALRALQAQQE